MEEFRTLAPCCMLSPVPAVMVSCRGVQSGDKPNIVTIAWAGTVNSNPPMVSISVQKKRFSYEMIRDSGDFDKTIVLITHSQQLAEECQRILTLQDGRIVGERKGAGRHA